MIIMSINMILKRFPFSLVTDNAPEEGWEQEETAWEGRAKEAFES